jgi:hypothetical protein
MALTSAGPLVDFRGMTLHRAEDLGWVHVDAALLPHLGEITVTDAVLTEPAHAQQDDLNRKATAFEGRRYDRRLSQPLLATLPLWVGKRT